MWERTRWGLRSSAKQARSYTLPRFTLRAHPALSALPHHVFGFLLFHVGSNTAVHLRISGYPSFHYEGTAPASTLRRGTWISRLHRKAFTGRRQTHCGDAMRLLGFPSNYSTPTGQCGGLIVRVDATTVPATDATRSSRAG